MMIIRIVEFIPPNGEEETVECEISDSLVDNYKRMLSKGCRITAEFLRMMNAFSVCIEEPNLGDFKTEFIPTGVNPVVTFEKMIREFDEKEFEKWKSALE